MRLGIALLACVGCGRSALGEAERRPGRDAGTDVADGGGDGDAGCIDGDGDGFLPFDCGGEDCDDADGAVQPGASERVAPWAIEDVRVTHGLGLAGPLVLDPDGAPHVVYGDRSADNESEYWSRTADGWRSEGMPFAIHALAVDPDGGRHVLSQEEGLTYRNDLAGDWSADEWLSSEWGNGALAVCADGAIHAVWSADLYVHHGVRIAGEWQTDLIDGPYLGRYWGTVIACGPDGIVRLAHARNAIVLATGASGDWTTEVVSWTDRGAPIRLAVTASGEPQVLFSESRYDHDDLVLATRGAAGWETSTVAQFGSAADLALDTDGVPQVAYAADGHVHVARRVAGAWIDEEIERTDGAAGTEIEIDAEGGLHVSYERVTDADYRLRYAYRPTGDGVDQDCDGRDLD